MGMSRRHRSNHDRIVPTIVAVIRIITTWTMVHIGVYDHVHHPIRRLILLLQHPIITTTTATIIIPFPPRYSMNTEPVTVITTMSVPTTMKMWIVLIEWHKRYGIYENVVSVRGVVDHRHHRKHHNWVSHHHHHHPRDTKYDPLRHHVPMSIGPPHT